MFDVIWDDTENQKHDQIHLNSLRNVRVCKCVCDVYLIVTSAIVLCSVIVFLYIISKLFSYLGVVNILTILIKSYQKLKYYYVGLKTMFRALL